MAIDLELLAAGDADFLLDDAATEHTHTRGEPDDAMLGVLGDLETQEGGGAHPWWDVSDAKTAGIRQEEVVELLEEQEGTLAVFLEPLRSPIKSRTKVEFEVLPSVFTIQVSDDSHSEVDVKARTKVKVEPNVTTKGKCVKRKPAVGKMGIISAKVTVKEDKKLTPLEIRRKRNRESMQRARRRQRDDVEQMKLTLQQLETHYQDLNDKSQARHRLSSSTSNSDRESMTLEANYYALADLSHTLKEERFLLEQMLVEKQKTHRRFQQVMVDRQQELELACPLTTDDVSLYSDYEFVSMTEDQANLHIRNCYQQMRLMEQTVNPTATLFEVPDGESSDIESLTSPDLPTQPKAEKKCAFPPSATFGWEVRHETNADGDFYVSFSKFFVGITPQQAMVSSWIRDSKPKSTPFRRKLRFEILQVINDSTYIAGLDIEHPVEHDKIMRMIFLIFRMQTEKGYVIGRHSMNPSSPEVRATAEKDSNFEYVDSSNWVEFSADHDRNTGEPGCLVKFIARTEYNTQEDNYVRLVNSISRTMIWELAVVPSSCRSLLLPS